LKIPIERELEFCPAVLEEKWGDGIQKTENRKQNSGVTGVQELQNLRAMRSEYSLSRYDQQKSWFDK
jgi:hypothetical protein